MSERSHQADSLFPDTSEPRVIYLDEQVALEIAAESATFTGDEDAACIVVDASGSSIRGIRTACAIQAERPAPDRQVGG
jgi:hypothetical protein